MAKTSNHANLSLRLLGSCVLLVSGLVVYWLFRPEIVLFQLLHIHNPTPLTIHSPFELVLKNYFADAVWCLALALVIPVLRDYQVPKGYRLTLAILPFFSEAMQAAGAVPGVFDWMDMAIYLCIMIPTFSKEFRPMNKMEKNITGSFALAFFTFALLATGSSREPPVYVTGTFTLLDRENEIFTKSAVVKSLNISENPSIVLRVPNPSDKVTEEQQQVDSVIYNLIEKEYAKAGYLVRDRQLFDKVLEQETSDYSKIGLITETDFILELLRYELKLKLRSGSYVDEAGKTAQAPYELSFNGAMAEFKLISVKNNDLVGAYTFYHTPCTEGCKERFDVNARSWSVNKDLPLDFFKTAAGEMIKEMGLQR